ncbi:hypothetical protein IT403_00625 [Candidatus Nomurabacteria bacterium]|nr:hypothetical protein [Candidatus Nomurabacteria bacterium]
MKNRILSASVTFLVFASLFSNTCFAQEGINATVKMNAANKAEIFTVEVTEEGSKKKVVQLVELYAVTSTGEPVLGLTYDGTLAGKAKTFDTDSTFLVIEGPVLDDARIMQIQMEFGNMFRESEKFVKDSIRYYQQKHPGIKKRARRKNVERLTIQLSELVASNKRNFDFLKTILAVRKGKSFVVYNYDVKNRYKLIRKVKKTSSG